MTLIYNVLFFLLALTILVAVHEWGHFIVARMVGVKVLRFSIGFGRPLISFMGKKGTRYILAMIPLGGYVKMLDEEEGEVKPSELNKAFNRKSVWARIAVVIAGPALNFIFAVLAFWLMFVIGINTLAPIIGAIEPNSMASKTSLRVNDELLAINQEPVRSWQEFQQKMVEHLGEQGTLSLTVKREKNPMPFEVLLPINDWQLDPIKPDLLKSLGLKAYLPLLEPVIGKVIENQPADKAGFKENDQIIEINTTPIQYWHEVLSLVQLNLDKTIKVKVLRNNSPLTLILTPEIKIYEGQKMGFIGIIVKKQFIAQNWLRNQKYSIYVSFKMAVKETKKLTLTSFNMIGKFLNAKISPRNIGGPIGIAEGAGQAASVGFVYYLSFLAFISISLGVINLLPIPMLDGGHLLFYLVEILLGRPVLGKVKEKCLMVGMALLLSLTVLAMFNDITRLLHT